MTGLFIFLLGLIIGSFLNVLIIRLHQRQGLLGRSICLSCQKIINWFDNIPVFSWLLLKGKCRFCQAKISWQYPLVELVTGILFLLAYFSSLGGSREAGQFFIILLLFRNWLFIAVLIVIFVYDLRWYLILDIITLPAIFFAFIINLLLGFNWVSLLFGAAIGGGFFLSQFIVSQGKWLGGGDIRLGLLMGVMLGWQLLLVALFFAYVVGALVGISLIILKKKKLSSPVPFGTFLAAATVVALLYGEKILDWYLQLI